MDIIKKTKDSFREEESMSCRGLDGCGYRARDRRSIVFGSTNGEYISGTFRRAKKNFRVHENLK